jgi:general secretion pathway protein G
MKTQEVAHTRFVTSAGFGLLCILLCGSCDHRPPMPRSDMRALGVSLDTFYSDCGRYPSNSEGFAALMKRPADVSEDRWRGPYMDLIPKDPWGRDYIYRYPGVHGPLPYDIYSGGPDGTSKSGGDDPNDINNWDASH